MFDLGIADDDALRDNYLVKFPRENELIMKKYDERIDQFETKIKKTIMQLNRMNHDLKQLMVEKENKENEFILLVNEHECIVKTKK